MKNVNNWVKEYGVELLKATSGFVQALDATNPPVEVTAHGPAVVIVPPATGADV